MIENKPTIYNTPTIYKTGAGGANQYGIDFICGKQYRIIALDNKIWLAQNLDLIIDEINFNPVDWTDGNRNCCYYGGGDTEYSENYGMLYNWAALKYISDNINDIAPGWRVPSKNDYDSLVNSIGGSSTSGKFLKSNYGWNNGGNGIDLYKFTTLPVGRRTASGSFSSVGDISYFWTETEYDASNAYYIGMEANNDYTYYYQTNKLGGLPIRLCRVNQ